MIFYPLKKFELKLTANEILSLFFNSKMQNYKTIDV